jgi:hypothetical protein
MSDEMTPLDRLFARSRPEMPAGLVERILVASWDPQVRRRHFWFLVAESTRGAFKAAAVLIVASLALAGYSRARASRPADDRDSGVDLVARLTVTGSSSVLTDPVDQAAVEGEGE